MEGVKYMENKRIQEPGDTLFLCKDGVPEAADAEKALFGTERMLSALNGQPDAAPEQALCSVRAAADDTVKEAEPFDDLTMLCPEYKGGGEPAADEQEFEAETEKLPEVLAFVDERLEAADCPPRTQMQIDVAVEEIFVNIAHYAYGQGKGRAKVRMTISGEPKEAQIIFFDSGIPYDPLSKPDPDVTLPAEERGIGGLGIYMTKKMMDETSYAYQDGQNVFSMRKKL